jgi:hypothetical protein
VVMKAGVAVGWMDVANWYGGRLIGVEMDGSEQGRNGSWRAGFKSTKGAHSMLDE